MTTETELPSEVADTVIATVEFLEQRCKTWHEVVVFDMAAGGTGFDNPVGQLVKAIWKARHEQ